jgi:hypothetical protein
VGPFSSHAKRPGQPPRRRLAGRAAGQPAGVPADRLTRPRNRGPFGRQGRTASGTELRPDLVPMAARRTSAHPPSLRRVPPPHPRSNPSPATRTALFGKTARPDTDCPGPLRSVRTPCMGDRCGQWPPSGSRPFRRISRDGYGPVVAERDRNSGLQSSFPADSVSKGCEVQRYT